ncbi:MAG TPA: acyl carrier protein [Ktedonobacteraceae bacterium]|jgi:acyl carrier protein|nr:acyl carrier protein [Ktedonobacteraceae bacterium]
MIERIRTILKENARLPIDVATLNDDSNLYDAGMSSHASVNVMLALEDEFEVEFPSRLLRRSVFSSITNIASALDELSENSEMAHG